MRIVVSGSQTIFDMKSALRGDLRRLRTVDLERREREPMSATM
jgi:hypothetical protein